MIKKIKTLMLSLSAVFAVAASAVIAVPALAATTPSIDQSVCEGGSTLQIPANAQPNAGACSNLETGDQGRNKLNDLIAKIINIFSIIVGVVAVIMIVFGGFRIITRCAKQIKSMRFRN